MKGSNNSSAINNKLRHLAQNLRGFKSCTGFCEFQNPFVTSRPSTFEMN